DVDAEIVGVELELVAGTKTAVFVDVHRDGGDASLVGDAPVLIAGGIGLIVDEAGTGAGVEVGGYGGFSLLHGTLLAPGFAKPEHEHDCCREPQSTQRSQRKSSGLLCDLRELCGYSGSIPWG